MQTTSNLIPPEQQEKARVLLALAWHFSGKPQGNRTISHHNALAQHIENEIEITCSGRSIKNFTASLEQGPLAGFKRSTTKETLAAYTLVKAGVIDEVEAVRDPTGRGINHPVHRYWILFEEHYESLKDIVPAEQTPSSPQHATPDQKEICPLKSVMAYFEGTWFLFSRARTGGIYRLLLFIEKEKIGHLNKVYIKNGSAQVEDYTGFVGADIGQEYLIFNLVTCESQKKHLHIKVKVGCGTLPQLAVGQNSFISSFSPQIMSDVIVLMRTPKDVNVEIAATCFLPDTPEYLELPLCLRRFFHEVDKCRLIAPRPDIINLHQLEEWLNTQRAQKEPSKSDIVLSWYCDEYSVFYETLEHLIEEQSLRILFNPDVEEIQAATATDCRSEFKNAQIFRCDKTITLFQTEITGSETRTFYLTFKIALGVKVLEFFCFEGFVSGWWQGLNGSTSRALVIKRSMPDFDSKSRQLVRDFFLTAFQVLES